MSSDEAFSHIFGCKKHSIISSPVVAVAAILCLLQLVVAQEPDNCAWDYNNPKSWGGLCGGTYALCGSGKQQSPISIDTSKAIKDVNIVTSIRFQSVFATSFNRSGLAEIAIATPSNDPYVYGGPVGGLHYLYKMSFHSPSEHAFDNFRASGSVQFWFQNIKKEPTYIMDLLFIDNTDTPNKWLDTVLNAMKTNSTKVDLSPQQTLPVDLSYYFYSGSETKPPCSQGWTWMILRQPVNATLAQIGAIRAWQGLDRIRPLQPLYGRNVTIEYSHLLVEEDPNTFVALLTVFSVIALVGAVVAYLIHRQATAEIEVKSAERKAYVQSRQE